ncbi:MULTISPECIES: flagellar basal body P-ring formation chaperone FlgA [unclassified Rhizobium]|uniref:flagellar basal body P-ring formation chaperone FlgA n=1 Tax=unclassified Rhizobium TaxID=2613769 RepID=UPI001ADACDF8|nr:MULTISPECIES: flagellar basal body P-ring formation chaperone FlgA [unclassified Rhizobium]MBO9122690.1 flagellar basal body P-ring formation protein FlgA [Rhizobium sp. 16-488-2b]MBO9173222.1 flagellar basal body P-ring formation protein FlgA [Rhizobium sp. 16-488-2a]
MTFCRGKHLRGWAKAAFVAAMTLASPAAFAATDLGYAVIPTTIIYPGETISSAQLQEVEVTNPNLQGDYAKTIGQVDGMISKRTLLPGQSISISALREPFTVTRGSQTRLIFTVGPMAISAAGSPLEDGMTGQMIRVRNMDSGVIVSGTVLANGTIHVAAK